MKNQLTARLLPDLDSFDDQHDRNLYLKEFKQNVTQLKNAFVQQKHREREQ